VEFEDSELALPLGSLRNLEVSEVGKGKNTRPPVTDCGISLKNKLPRRNRDRPIGLWVLVSGIV